MLGEIGTTWGNDEPVDIHDLRHSLTLILGADTVIGPLFLAYARADTSESRFYVTIGKTF